MARIDFYVKQSDQEPKFTATLRDAVTLEPTDIQGAEVRLKMRDPWGTDLKVDVAVDNLDDGTEELRGHVEYEWAAEDVDTSGLFLAELEASFVDKAETFPNDGYFRIAVVADLDPDA